MTRNVFAWKIGDAYVFVAIEGQDIVLNGVRGKKEGKGEERHSRLRHSELANSVR